MAGVSLALVGYDVSETDLRDRLNSMALLVGHVTTDLHVAAKWRNEPDRHPNIIALATGRYPGVSTLAHFPQGNARTLAARLLEWAQTDPAALTSTPAQKRLLAALEEAHALSPLRPCEVSIAHYGEKYDLRSIIGQMQEALHERGITTEDFCGLWDRIVDARRVVLDDVAFLLLQPVLAIAGKPALRAAAAELGEAWERLYDRLARHHGEMHDIDHAWTRMLLEAVTSLDVVQIRTRLDERRSSWKAVLLPTLDHEEMDREAVLEQLERPEHYLGVLWLTSFPEGRGGSQPLPVARDHCGLAVFENLRNAYSGSDGIEALQRCVRQFAQIYVNHTQPLRLALVNPPKASEMLLALLKDGRGRRGPGPTLLVDIYATQDHEARLAGARRFSTRDRDQIEEHIGNGRLRLRVHDRVTSLAERLHGFHDRPVHILAVFDEASTDMRQQPGGINLLPMSPFAMRRRIAYQRDPRTGRAPAVRGGHGLPRLLRPAGEAGCPVGPDAASVGGCRTDARAHRVGSELASGRARSGSSSPTGRFPRPAARTWPASRSGATGAAAPCATTPTMNAWRCY